MELKIGQTYDVKVVNILPFGAVVELEDNSTQLIHISNISTQFVSDVSRYVQHGATYSALCKAGKFEDRPIELSLAHLDLQPTTDTAPVMYKPSRNSGTDRKTCSSRNSSKPRTNVVRPHAAPRASLDDMIANSASQFEDKFGSRKDDSYGYKKAFRSKSRKRG